MEWLKENMCFESKTSGNPAARSPDMQQAELASRDPSITDPTTEMLLRGWKGCDRNNPSKLPTPHFNSLTVTTPPLDQIPAAQPQS